MIMNMNMSINVDTSYTTLYYSLPLLNLILHRIVRAVFLPIDFKNFKIKHNLEKVIYTHFKIEKFFEKQKQNLKMNLKMNFKNSKNLHLVEYLERRLLLKSISYYFPVSHHR